MNKQKTIIGLFLMVLLLLTGCGKSLDDKVQKFEDRGVSYKMQLPGGWKKDEEKKIDYGLQSIFSAEDTRSNSYLSITTTPKNEVTQENFGGTTREKLKERYGYTNVNDIYMRKLKVGDYLAYQYTLNTVFMERSVWAHFYYIWTENGFVQAIFYSADDNRYETRFEQIDAAIATLKETSYDKEKAQKEAEKVKEEEGDIVTIENRKVKMEITAVRQVTGADNKKLLAVRYTFTNLSTEALKPKFWESAVTAKQNEKVLSIGKLPEDTALLDVKELANAQETDVKAGESIESVAFYILSDQSTVELSFSQTEFPGLEPTRVVVPK